MCDNIAFESKQDVLIIECISPVEGYKYYMI